MDPTHILQEKIDEIREVHESTIDILVNTNTFEDVVKCIVHCLKQSGKKLLLAGNGGSAADAQHISGEYVSRFAFDRPALPAIALTTDTSILTAVANDYGYQEVFSRQVEAYGEAGDIFIAYSTSGSSRNIIEAAIAAKKLGLTVIGFTGLKGNELVKHSNFSFQVPSSSTPRIQEMHALIGHLICEAVERIVFCENNDK